MTRWATLGLVLLVALAGCSALSFGDPTPQEEPAPVKLVNNATMTETFEVAVVDRGENVTINRSYGETFDITIDQGSSTTTTTSNNTFIKATFPDSAQIYGNYTLEPGENRVLHIGTVAPNQAIVVLVYDEPEGTYRSINYLSCAGGSILGYRVRAQSGGPENWTPSTFECG